MENIKSSLIKPILKSFLPLFIGGSYHLCKETFTSFSLMGSDLALEEKFDRSGGSGLDETNPEAILSFDFLNKVSFGVYTNFFTFLLVMLLIDGLCKIAQKNFWKEAKLSISSDSLNSSFSRKRKVIKYLMAEKQVLRIFVYALIFISLQLAGLCFMSLSPSQTLPFATIENSQGLKDSMRTTRALEEEKQILANGLIPSPLSPPPPLSDKISLSMGSILGSLNLNVKAMVLSKDRKTAYVTIDHYGTLKIIDISDLQAPFVISSLNLPGSYPPGYLIKNLLLSSDEKTLYASNTRDMEIIDVTDLTSPKRISLTKSEIFKEDLYSYMKTPLAFEEKTKTLYIGGLGLEIYDVSDPKNPLLLKGFRNEWKRTYPLKVNDLCLSRDGQVLFIANGTLDIYNISNPKDLKLLNSFQTKSFPRSIVLSEEGNTAFLLGVPPDNSDMIFEEVDISDYDSLKVRNTISIGHNSSEAPRILAISPSKTKIFMTSRALREANLLVFDIVKQRIIKNEKSLVEGALALDFSPDSRTLISASSDQFMTIELFLDYPNRQIFSESLDREISLSVLQGGCSNMQISNDGKFLFILRSKTLVENGVYPIFEIWDVKNSSEPKSVSSYDLDKSIKNMHLTKNDETVYLVSDKYLIVLDIKDKSSISVKKTFETPDKDKVFVDFITSPDEKTGFLISSKDVLGDVTALNLSESSLVQVNSTIATQFKSDGSQLIMKDEKTLILFLRGSFLIFDVSNLNSPIPIASLNFCLDEPEPDSSFALLSPDKMTLYIETSDKNGLHKLRAYDVSNPTLPRFLSEKSFSKLDFLNIRPGFTLSPADPKTGFMYQRDQLVKLDLKSPKEIKISGVIPLSSDSQPPKYLISPDGQTLYSSLGAVVYISNMNIKYSLFLKQEKFLLGEKYSGDVAILNLTGGSSSFDYELVDSGNYKITKLSLLDINVVPNKYTLGEKISLLPSWIAFESESNILTVDARKQRDIGAYTFHSAFSLKISEGVFGDLGKTKAGKPVSVRNLWAWLISLGYVDNQRFLTANFGSKDSFYLPEEFEDFESKIYDILKQFHFETCTGFEIVPSLELKENNDSLGISTSSFNSIKVDIKLEPKNGSDVKFVSSSYGSLVPVVKNNNKTRISLEGSVREINTALNHIVVNFENGTSCEASITINDGFNPAATTQLTNISRYFKANTPPQLNNETGHQTVQEQVNSADIQTGKYFAFTLSNDIFKDENIENLSYELAAENNQTAFPTWLSLHGLNLKGTPPKEVLGRDIDLVLIAKNEFKEAKVGFRIHVNISLSFWLELIRKYIPYVLTIVGLWVSANKIWNVLGAKYYKHFKEFHLGAGQEISPALIEPISFIKEELEQSRLIWKYFGKSEKELLMGFVDPITKVLEKQKIAERIKETVDQMSLDERKKLTKYPSPVIEKIIVNKFVSMQLDLEKETKALFKELESHCMEVVKCEASEFIIEQKKLDDLIERTRPRPIGGNENLEEGLLLNPSILTEGVNLNLLKDAILALAFEHHTLNILPVKLDIGVKQRIRSNFLWRFLKLDLKDIYLGERTKMNYGIDFEIIDDKLCFYGVTKNYLKGKTLVVQIKTKRQRIMKEIWIHGASNDFLVAKDEQENKGQGYEIF